jgi:hypothetical protein
MNSDWRKDYIRYRTLFSNLTATYKSRADVKVYLEVLLSLITISVFTVFALRPTVVTIAQLLKDIDAKKAVLVQINAKIENLARAQSVYEAERSRIVFLDNAVPKASKQDIFARQFEGLIGSHHVDVDTFNQSKGIIVGNAVPRAASAVTIPEDASSSIFSLSVSTNIDNYQALSGFLSDLEKLRMAQVIENVKISKGNEKEQQKVILFVQGELPYLLPTK